MSGCDVSSFGGGFQSKKNKQSVRIDVRELGNVLSHSVKDKKGKLIASRDFKIGEYARIVRSVWASGKEIDESKIKDLDELPCGEVLGFWTCLDGKDPGAAGAEIQRDGFRVRLPLRTLLPMENPNPKRETDPEECP